MAGSGAIGARPAGFRPEHRPLSRAEHRALRALITAFG